MVVYTELPLKVQQLNTSGYLLLKEKEKNPKSIMALSLKFILKTHNVKIFSLIYNLEFITQLNFILMVMEAKALDPCLCQDSEYFLFPLHGQGDASVGIQGSAEAHTW